MGGGELAQATTRGVAAQRKTGDEIKKLNTWVHTAQRRPLTHNTLVLRAAHRQRCPNEDNSPAARDAPGQLFTERRGREERRPDRLRRQNHDRLRRVNRGLGVLLEDVGDHPRHERAVGDQP